MNSQREGYGEHDEAAQSSPQKFIATGAAHREVKGRQMSIGRGRGMGAARTSS